MGVKNYVIDGVSCAGKTTVCNELQRRGYHAIHGDRALAYWGDPNTGAPVPGGAGAQRTWMWNVATVSALVADHTHVATFFCGGSRNADRFIDMWDGVFVLAIDLATLNRRLAARPADAGANRHSQAKPLRESNMRHTNAISIDATTPCHASSTPFLTMLLLSLPDMAWVSVSAGSLVMTPRIGKYFVEWSSAPDDRTLGVVDFAIFPHLNLFPTNTLADAERWAADIGVPAYAIDEQTAFKVVDGVVDVVSEGHWKQFTHA